LRILDRITNKNRILDSFAFVRYWRKNGRTRRQLLVDSRKSDSVRREVLYNIFIEFGVPMKLARLIKCV
jgi:hypothetical protein